MLAANLSWQALRNSFHTDNIPFGLLVHQGYLAACCRDACLLTSQLARHLRLDSGLLLHATVAVGAPKTAPLIPVVTDSSGFPCVPGDAWHPHTVQPVSTGLLPADGDEALKESTQELFTDMMNQFGLEPQP